MHANLHLRIILMGSCIRRQHELKSSDTSSPHELLYDRGFSFFSFHNAVKPTPETLTTLKRTPGISPLALPFRPKPASSTSSFSSTKFKQPSRGTDKGCQPNNLQRHPYNQKSPIGRSHSHTESRDFLSVFNQLYSDTFSDGRVRLFCLNTNFFQHNTLSM